jgi:hypothetical protein
MTVTSVRSHLRTAAEEVDLAREELTATDAEEYLTGIVRLLDHYADGNVTDPEAKAYPPPGALDTIQRRLTEVIETTDDPAAAHLRNARAQLIEVILALDERLHEGRPATRRG